jgi:CheY-like chemotaxis protein
MSDNAATILVVDDTPEVLGMIVKVLSTRGYQVLAARSGQEAIEHVRRASPDLVLLDLSMPRLNGWETLLALRQLPQMAELPVIAVTAHAMKGDREAVMQHGFTGYITKPLDMPLFLETVSSVLQSRGVHSR